MVFLQAIRSWRKSVVVAWFIVSAFVFIFVLLPVFDTDTGAEGHRSHYVRSNQDNGVIVFVHGVLGDSVSTWTNPNTKAYWPELLTTDRAFDRYNIFVVEFPSALQGRSYSIDELADVMNLVLRGADVLAHNKIIFLSHSMGGLVTRAFLLKYRDELVPKIGFLYFFSTPTTGSELSDILQLVSRNPQFNNMIPMGTNIYLESLQSSWLAAKLKVRSYCSYEIRDTYGLNVVTRQSATSLCTERLTPLLEDHISIVKPAYLTSLPYSAFKEAFVESQKPSSGPQ
jgi:pimeloyl-ACP methyl ester carboxylesterase